MTRLNPGIPVEELCDKHLVAEYRELPRMVKFVAKTKTIRNVDFTLNTGHMKSCARYGAYLADRHAELIAEMRHRGFKPNMPAVRREAFRSEAGYFPSQAWLALAAAIVRPRIIDRIRTMKNPAWTNRERPTWIVQ